MSFIFTIFNHGTDFNADNNSYEIVTFLHNLLPKDEEARIIKDEDSGRYIIKNSSNSTYMINMGVGSESVDSGKSTRGYSYSTPGTKNPFTGELKSESSPHNPSPLAALKGPQSASTPKKESLYKEALGDSFKTEQTPGRVFGLGWDDNVARSLDIICGLAFDHNRRPDVINLVGWSRGAVTTLLIANAIFDVFHYDIVVNIFSIDPVPGGATKRINSRITDIPPNVNNYFAIIALDDVRVNFQPTDRGDIARLSPDEYPNIPRPNGPICPPNTHFLPLPGNHSCVAGAFADTSKAHPAMRNVANLVRHLALKFLLSHGTPLKMGSYIDPIESPEDVVFYYDFIIQCKDAIQRQCELPHYLKDPVRRIASGGKQIRRVRQQARKEHVGGNSDVFLNDHHEMCWSLTNNKSPRDNGGSQYGQYPSRYSDHPRQCILSKMGFVYSPVIQMSDIKDSDIQRNIQNKTYFTNDNTVKSIGFINGDIRDSGLLLPSNYKTSGSMINSSEWETRSKANGLLATRKTILAVDNALTVYRLGFEVCSDSKKWTAMGTIERRRAIKHRVKNANILVDACNYYLASGQGSRTTAVNALIWLATHEIDALISVL